MSGTRTATASPRPRSGWPGSVTTSASSRPCSRATGTQHATFEGRYSQVRNARNVPKPIQQPRVPIMVGGNGPNVTWRLAARHADELNLDGMTPSEVAEAIPVIHARCEEVGRDPASLAVSIHLWSEYLGEAGPARVDLLAGYRELGISRAMGIIRASATNDDALPAFIEDARAAGLAIG